MSQLWGSAGCGAKLPYAIAEEENARQKDAAELEKWGVLLPEFPVWSCGGCDYELEEFEYQNGQPSVRFSVNRASPAALNQYCAILKQNGFRSAGRYPSESSLYKKVNGVCWCFNCSDAFCSGEGEMSVGFNSQEPDGGFDYVKPEPKKQLDLKGLFKF